MHAPRLCLSHVQYVVRIALYKDEIGKKNKKALTALQCFDCCVDCVDEASSGAEQTRKTKGTKILPKVFHPKISSRTYDHAGSSHHTPDIRRMVHIEDETLRLDTVCQPLQVRDRSAPSSTLPLPLASSSLS